MKDVLKKLRLKDDIKFELDIDKNDFLIALKNNVDEKQSGFFEAFSSGKNEYKGIVTQDNFDIKRKRRFFDTNLNFAKAKGTISQKESKLIIEAEINAFHGHMMIVFFALILFYSVFIISYSTADKINGNVPLFALPFIFSTHYSCLGYLIS